MAVLEFGDHLVYAWKHRGGMIMVASPEQIESVLFDYYSYIEVALKDENGRHDRTIHIRGADPREKDAFKDWLLRNHFLGESVPDDQAEGNIWKPDPDYYPDQEEK